MTWRLTDCDMHTLALPSISILLPSLSFTNIQTMRMNSSGLKLYYLSTLPPLYLFHRNPKQDLNESAPSLCCPSLFASLSEISCALCLQLNLRLLSLRRQCTLPLWLLNTRMVSSITMERSEGDWANIGPHAPAWSQRLKLLYSWLERCILVRR